jgi:hypothetical protein
MIKRLVTALTALILACAHGYALAQSEPPVAPPTAPPRDGITSDARAGTLKSVRGNVQVLGPNGASRSVDSGDALTALDRLVTGADSGASVVLRDGTQIIVGPSSILDLKEFQFNSTTQDGGMFVFLLRGSLRMISGLIGKTNPSGVRVETPTAVIGIRGTDFIVEVSPQ